MAKGGGGGQLRTNQPRLAVVERQRQALELRRAGVGFDQIAQQLGYEDRSGAYRAVVAGLKKTLQEPADELRELELSRLDQLLLAVWTAAANLPKKPNEPARMPQHLAIDRVLRIMERRAALLGLDAPKRAEVSGADGAPIEINVVDVRERLRAQITELAARRPLLPVAQESGTVGEVGVTEGIA